jgi:hypothetical protein
MSGRDGHYHGVDKNAETNINFQKVTYIPIHLACRICSLLSFTGLLGCKS